MSKWDDDIHWKPTLHPEMVDDNEIRQVVQHELELVLMPALRELHRTIWHLMDAVQTRQCQCGKSIKTGVAHSCEFGHTSGLVPF